MMAELRLCASLSPAWWAVEAFRLAVVIGAVAALSGVLWSCHPEPVPSYATQAARS